MECDFRIAVIFSYRNQNHNRNIFNPWTHKSAESVDQD